MRGVTARGAFLAAKGGCQQVYIRNDASRHHIGAVADARGHVANRGRRYAEFGKVVDPGNAGAVAPDPGVIENRRRNAELGREVRSIEAPMRAIDDNGAIGFGADAGDAVGSED
jgi:hypothetical protein